jgi:hypothetical protein
MLYKGAHTHVIGTRVIGFAIMDVTMTVLGGALLAYIFKWSYLWTILILFLLGILLHRLFCVRTTLDKALFN